MADKQTKDQVLPVENEMVRAEWIKPELTQMVAGAAEVGPNPSADAGNLS